MGISVGLFSVEDVVGRNYLGVVFCCQPQKHIIHVVFFREAMADEFHIKVVAKNLYPPLEKLFTLALALVQDGVRNLAA